MCEFILDDEVQHVNDTFSNALKSICKIAFHEKKQHKFVSFSSARKSICEIIFIISNIQSIPIAK